MIISPMTCESCERAEAAIADLSDDEHEPYHLCRKCHERLHLLALRPLEWYNLAKRHGPMRGLLHDDFYDEDGTAHQPDIKVEDSRRFPAPLLAEVAHDAGLLCDYSVTRWIFDFVLEDAWSRLAQHEILPLLAARFAAAKNLWVRGRILEICAAALGSAAAGFVRYCWSEYPENVELAPLAKATAATLPHREGFDRVVRALDEMITDRRELPMHALAHFRSPDALDWIEGHLSPTGAITSSWGSLGACSRPDWKRMQQWLEQGRPFSLVALDILATIADPRDFFGIPHDLKLEDPPDSSAIRTALSDYVLRDPVPRVQQRVAWILQHQDRLS